MATPSTAALSSNQKVLIVTGGMLSAKEESFLQAIKKQLASFRASSGAWLDLELKLLGAENLLAGRRQIRGNAFVDKPYAATVERIFGDDKNFTTPELTEVALATLLDAEGLSFSTTTYAELYADPELRERLLSEHGTVFASTTLLRDLSELRPMIAMLKRPHNRVVAGGALAAILHQSWSGCEGVDVLAIGYGELLVPSLARWIKSGHQELAPPPTGRLLNRAGTLLLYSGVPATKSLDDLPAPDWALAERVHRRRFPMVNYESVRGCPYRCGFCNYPFLFDDTRFRTKSAQRIADDWAQLYAQGVEYITCLDSLFTMPRRRLVELCELLIAREIKVRWICYARADDLAELSIVELMKRAGCHQVQIGIESGNQGLLDNMNKRCTVEANRQALLNCRQAGLTSLVTVIIGYPGETAETVDQTFELLRSAPPDVYYAAPFNTRVEYVPVLSEESRQRFSLSTVAGGDSSAPYWRHATMSCEELGTHLRRFNRRMMEQRVALEGSLFYRGVLEYRAADRELLLDFQEDVIRGHRRIHRLFGKLIGWAERRLARDVERKLGAAPSALLPAGAPALRVLPEGP